MTALATLDERTAAVRSIPMADGLLVILDGPLTRDAVAQLRDCLLRPLPPGCRDVIVDAGAVTEVDDEALAVLLAATDWALQGRRRFALSRSGPALDAALHTAKLDGALPRLGPARRPAAVPSPRRG